jgi:uncharacterized protein (DUF2141 family)
MAPRALLAALFVLATAVPARAGELVVRIHGLEAARGQVLVQLYSEAERVTFPYSERGVTAELRLKAHALDAPATDASIGFGNLAPGRYAIVVVDDENGNGDLDRNLLGIPTEGYGFSNGVRPTLRPPSFDEAALAVAASGTTLADITMRR